MKRNHFIAFTAVAAAGSLIFAGCAKKPEPQDEKEVVVAEPAAAEVLAEVAAPVPAPMITPETVLVTVDGNTITQGDINNELSKMFPNDGSVPPEQIAQMQAQMSSRILETLIVKQLLEKEADAKNITVSDEELAETIDKMKASLPEGTTLEEQLAKMNLSEADFMAALRDDLRINNLMKEVLGLDQEPTDEEVTAFYNDNPEMFERPEVVDASHILIAVKPDDDDAAKAEKKAKAEAIQKQLVEGADFAELAAAESDCPSKARGGNLGTFPRGQMVPEFEDAAFSQTVGEVGPVVETQFGYHIIEVNDHKDAGTVPLDEAREMIVVRMNQEKGRTAVKEYVTKLKDDADIQYPAP